MSGPTVFGPSQPSSTWPLDHVPGPILDILAGYFINMDKKHQLKDADAGELDNGSVFPAPPVHRTFTKDMQALSLVDKSFRHSVVKEGIFSHVVLKTKKQSRLVIRQLGIGARSYVT